MSRISDLGQNLNLRSLTAGIRERIADAQVQVTTGRRAETYSGLGLAEGLTSLSLRGDVERIEAYRGALAAVGPRVDLAETALDGMGQALRGVVNSVLKIPASGEPNMRLIRDEAQKALGTVAAFVNTEIGGRFIFAGSRTDQRPLPDVAALRTNVAAELAEFTAGTDDATQTLADLGALTPTELGLDPNLATAGPVTVKADDGLTLDYTVRADGSGFLQALRGLATLAEIAYTPTDDAGFHQILRMTATQLEDAARDLDGERAKLGLVTNQIDDTKDRLDATRDIFNRFVGEAEDVDVAEAIGRLQQLQTQLEASYRVLSELNQLSLLDFLN